MQARKCLSILFVVLMIAAVALPMAAQQQIIWPPEPVPDEPAVCTLQQFAVYQTLANYLPFLTPDLWAWLEGCYPF